MDLAFSTMAVRSDRSPARWRRPLLSWMDGIEEGWAIPLLLIGFVAAWLAFLVIAYVGGDLHSDVLETWTLGRNLEWGYSKHPPLMGWLSRAWTSVFPLTNWSFQLLALANSALALWAVDLISRRFVSGDKRMVVLLLLMLLPIYQLHAQRFNANAVLLATWPIAIYCFLRSFETREIRWAVAAGAAAALAMLGKYYSVFLLAGFVFAAICHPQRRGYFASLAPWISTLVLLAVLAPHVQWLLETGAPPFAYALARHTGKAFIPSLIEAVLFILGVGLLLAIPAVISVLMAGDRLREFWHDSLAMILGARNLGARNLGARNFGASNLGAMNPGLLLLLMVGIATIVFPAITAVALGADMPPLWSLQGLFLFVILMVCGTSYPIERFYSVNLAALVIGMAVAAVVVVAPLHAYYRNDHPLHEGRNFYRQSAAELTRRWHEQSDKALPLVGGDEGLAFAAAFYSPDHPQFEGQLVFPRTEQLPREVNFERGWAALCYDADTHCIASMQMTAARASRFVKADFVVQSTRFGQPGASQRFAALIVPPYNENFVPSPGPGPTVAQNSPEGAADLVRQDEPTCCAPRAYPDGAESRSELALRPSLPVREIDKKHARRATPPASAYQVYWQDRPFASALRDGFARWPVPVPAPRCAPGGNGPGCAPAARARPPVASRNPGATTAFCADSGLSERRGVERTEGSISDRLKHQFCTMAANFDAESRMSRQRHEMFTATARERADRQLQLWRRDSMKDSVPAPQRRRI